MTPFDGTEGRGMRGATGEHRGGHRSLIRSAATPAPDAAEAPREHRGDGVEGPPGSAQRIGRLDWERFIRFLRLGAPTKAVALMLATYADGDGGNIHPGVDRLAAELECHERTIRRHLSRLAELGLIEKTFSGSSAGRRRLADCWALTVPTDAATRIGLTPHPALR